jgi:FkbM family methyltransferase
MRTFCKEGCKFEVLAPIEAFRVEGYGGEEEFTRLILEEVNAGDVLFDIGACVGLVSVHAAKKGVFVCAFEPDHNYRSRLETNLRLNKLNNVQIIKWAVSDMVGNVTLYTDGLEGNSPSLRKVGDRGQVTVPTDTIDNALQRNEIPYPDVIKMDIEGAEMLALRGMNRLLTSVSAPRKIFIEIHVNFLNEFKSSPDAVIKLLETFQYKQVYYAQCHDQIHAIFLKNTDNQSR